jgi:hypothetical protein
MRKVKIRALGNTVPTTLIVRIVARQGSFPATPSELPLRAAIVVGDGASGECADTAFGAGSCAFGPLGRRVVCD